MSPNRRPSAISLIVKSNSLRATKSIGARRGEARLRLDRDLGADEADLEPRVDVLQRLGDLDVGGEGRGRGVQHRQLVIAGERQHVVERAAAPAARRSACCRAPAPPAGPARSDTRTSGSRASPGSASRRRRRTRRTTAGAGTGSSSCRLVPLDTHPPARLDAEQLVAPQHAAPAEATDKHRKRQNIAQRQQPQPAARQVETARDRRRRAPSAAAATAATNPPRPSPIRKDRGGQRGDRRRCGSPPSRRSRPAPSPATVRAQRSSCRHRLAKARLADAIFDDIGRQHGGQPKPAHRGADALIVGQFVAQRGRSRRSAPVPRGAARSSRRSSRRRHPAPRRPARSAESRN